ncbi:polymorphic toxin type 44 domain-containing protein [Streptomyces sp. NBC_01294]|uniref:polymorphic toxin type 44 domain-containing protein n=1 Tax=Streptomyces sp. NBC_01294 TaxID=2903815 RepID=UPI002DDA3C4E|nr:polymorphic toxin type 44 domain-containing protein [Streptomyces sp. NBC_01294]WRZ61646.1 polymorphic toxin type 44 domain-containing protein [Streptomyces sp. NBC_01294]WRZ62156.1 polymorphic toxin type 44 domain-containing protein [Streptomyces sp. NBC_01294]
MPNASFASAFSNVHYGYVGRAAGCDAGTLIKGAYLGSNCQDLWITWRVDMLSVFEGLRGAVPHG